MHRQCKLCPWKTSTNPFEIPNGYNVALHRNLINTIAHPSSITIDGPLRIMACHHSPVGAETPCVGWLHNQLGVGNNIALRFAVHTGRLSGDYKLSGDQHPTFEDTLPDAEDR